MYHDTIQTKSGERDNVSSVVCVNIVTEGGLIRRSLFFLGTNNNRLVAESSAVEKDF